MYFEWRVATAGKKALPAGNMSFPKTGEFTAFLFEEIFSFEAVFIFVSWFHGITKKNELRGGMLWRILIAIAISLPVAKGKQAKTLESPNFEKVQNFLFLIRSPKEKSWAHQPIDH